VDRLKHSPLHRRTPLKRGGWLKPTRKRREPTPPEWREDLGPCRRCGSTKNVEGHHVIPRRILRTLGLGWLIWDRRNRLPLCARCHGRHEMRVAPIPAELLPLSAWEFADEAGLRWYIERHYEPTSGATAA
jgi:hypothetical protein